MYNVSKKWKKEKIHFGIFDSSLSFISLLEERRRDFCGVKLFDASSTLVVVWCSPPFPPPPDKDSSAGSTRRFSFFLKGATFQCSFLMANKSVSTGVDDSRATPQGAHPFCRGHQGTVALFIRFHYSYLIRARPTTL